MANAAKIAERNGYGAFQLFVTNSRSWAPREVKAEESRDFQDSIRRSGATAFAHAPYLCNPSSPRNDVFEKSVSMLKHNVRNCGGLGVRHLVVHLGSHLGTGSEAALVRIGKAFETALADDKGVEILLENSAGYRNSVGSSFKEIGAIIKEIGSKSVGVCLDTCHAFAAGYEISTAEGTKAAMDEIEEHIGLERIKCVHLNDSKFALGSGLDRHWYIGKGFIGRKGFVEFFRNSKLPTKCFVMETPMYEDADNDYNMSAAVELMTEAGYKL